MNESDRQLLERPMPGDQATADRLVDHFHKRIYAYHRRLTGDTHEAEDLTQLTFTKAWRSLGGFSGRSTLSAWLHGIAYHVFVDWMRKRRPSEPQSDKWWETRQDPRSDFDHLTERDTAQVLWAAAEELSEDLRQTIHLHYYQELTLQETADALGIAVSTVKFRVNKAIEALKKHLAEPESKSIGTKL